MTPLHELTAHESVRALHAGEVSSSDLVEASLARIADDRWGSFLAVDAEGARARAAEIDALDERPPLAGIPIAIKDALSTRDLTTTAASRILEGFRPLYTATCVERLERAGAVVIGKTNMDEFAMGSSTENSAYQLTRNPWDPERVPGGSSGGSAAAVAAFQAPWALGSDTGGSIRQPAALCGIVGMKPTYGAVSRYGLIAFASSLDQVGPFARNVRDSALLLSHIVGHDEMDSTSLEWREPIAVPTATDLRGRAHRRRGRADGGGGRPRRAQRRRRRHRRTSRRSAAPRRRVSLPTSEHGVATYYLIAPAECSANLARFDGIRYGPRVEGAEGILEHYESTRGALFGREVKRRIMLGTFALASGYYDAYYLRALKVRTLIRRDFARAFADGRLRGVADVALGRVPASASGSTTRSRCTSRTSAPSR